MNWTSWTEFCAMGGYGLYVWGAYGVAVVGMLAEPLLARRRHRIALQAALGAAQDEAQD